MKKKELDNEHLAEIQKEFQLIDENSDGFITYSELKVILDKFDVKISDSEIRKWLKERDINKDGKINYEEFIKVFQN